MFVVSARWAFANILQRRLPWCSFSLLAWASCHSSKADPSPTRAPVALWETRSQLCGGAERDPRGSLGLQGQERHEGRQEAAQPHPAGPPCLRLSHGPSRRAGHVTSAPPLAPSRGSSRPAGPSFRLLRSHKISQRPPFGILPPVPAPLPSKLSWVLSRLARIISNEKESLFRPTGLPAAVIRHWGREGGETQLGTLFCGGGCSGRGHFTTGGGAVRPRWRRPVGWRNCEVNS